MILRRRFLKLVAMAAAIIVAPVAALTQEPKGEWLYSLNGREWLSLEQLQHTLIGKEVEAIQIEAQFISDGLGGYVHGLR